MAKPKKRVSARKPGKKRTAQAVARKPADKTLARAYYLLTSLPDDFDLGDRDDPPQERDWFNLSWEK